MKRKRGLGDDVADVFHSPLHSSVPPTLCHPSGNMSNTCSYEKSRTEIIGGKGESILRALVPGSGFSVLLNLSLLSESRCLPQGWVPRQMRFLKRGQGLQIE